MHEPTIGALLGNVTANTELKDTNIDSTSAEGRIPDTTCWNSHTSMAFVCVVGIEQPPNLPVGFQRAVWN